MMRNLFAIFMCVFLVSCSTVDVAGPGDPVDVPVALDFPAGVPINWVSMNAGKAQVIPNLKSIEMSGGKLQYNYNKLNWPDVGGNVDAILCAFFLRNGQWTGGKFEWSRPGMTVQGYGNLTGGYIKGIKPFAEGEDFYFCILKPDGKIRTNALKCQWRTK